MYAILNPSVSLRSWIKVPYSYYNRNSVYPGSLTKEEFEILLLADGEHEIPDNEISRSLLNKNFMKECKKGEFHLTKWQEPQFHLNRLMPRMNLQITGRCNFNCKHCFNAKDNEKLNSQLSYEEIINLLDQAEECGIHTITITGGEPTIHKDIKKILKAIADRNFILDDFNSNGFLINQDFLDYIKELGLRPCIKISFDGIGCHDEMRGFIGAEKDAIRAIKLSIENGFEVMAQVNVNKNNVDCIYKTIDFLDSIGIHVIRLIRTTEVPRWIINGGECLTVEEYYDAMIEIAQKYIEKERKADLIIWQLMTVNPKSKSFKMSTINDDIKESSPLCSSTRGMIAIGANGQVYPCMQMSGGFDYYKIDLGNIKKTNLCDILQTNTQYMKLVCETIKEKADKNKICNKCQYFKYCGTGCPALSASKAFIEGKPFTMENPDEWKCLFYKKRYDLKIIKALVGYKCKSPEIKVQNLKEE